MPKQKLKQFLDFLSKDIDPEHLETLIPYTKERDRSIEELLNPCDRTSTP